MLTVAAAAAAATVLARTWSITHITNLAVLASLLTAIVPCLCSGLRGLCFAPPTGAAEIIWVPPKSSTRQHKRGDTGCVSMRALCHKLRVQAVPTIVIIIVVKAIAVIRMVTNGTIFVSTACHVDIISSIGSFS